MGGPYADFVQAYRRAWAEEAAEARTWCEQLHDHARRLGRICQTFGARRVVLFGSVARGDARVGSDIDLAVAGVPEERFFDLYGRILEASPVEVDLVDLADCSESLRTRIGEEGVEI